MTITKELYNKRTLILIQICKYTFLTRIYDIRLYIDLFHLSSYLSFFSHTAPKYIFMCSKPYPSSDLSVHLSFQDVYFSVLISISGYICLSICPIPLLSVYPSLWLSSYLFNDTIAHNIKEKNASDNDNNNNNNYFRWKTITTITLHKKEKKRRKKKQTIKLFNKKVSRRR